MNDDTLYMLGIIYNSLKPLLPPGVNPNITPTSNYGYFNVALGDGTPDFQIHAAKFARWLKSPKASWQALKEIARRKTTTPQQQHLPLN